MVITMELKHVILRGKTYHFRMPVPRHCIKKIGKGEIVQSLHTSDPLQADAAAKKLAAVWKEKFKPVRRHAVDKTAKPAMTSPAEDTEAFHRNLIEQMQKNLPEILRAESDTDLQHRLDFYEGSIVAIKTNDWVQRHLPEIGVHLPLTPSTSPGFDRVRKRILNEVLQQMCRMVAEELGITEEGPSLPEKNTAQPPRSVPDKSAEIHEHILIEAVELMIAAKRIPEKTAVALRADVKLLKEWCGGKDCLTGPKSALHAR